MSVEWVSLPLDKENWWVKNHGVKPFNLKFPVFTFGDKGPKILLILDRVPTTDLKVNKLLGTNTVNPLLKVLDYIGKDVSEVHVLNLPCFKVNTLNEDDEKRAVKDFWNRAVSYIKKIKPDCTVLCGHDSIRMGLSETPFKISIFELGRVKTMLGKYKCVPSLPYHRICSTLPDEKKTLSGLLGEFSRHLEAAIDGVNAYDISGPHKVKIINTIPKFNKFYKKLMKAKRPCWDSEFTNLSYRCNKLLCLQCCLNGKVAYFLPYHHPSSPFSVKEIEYIRSKLKDYLENHTAEFWIAHQAKAEMGSFKFHLGVQFIPTPVYDTMCAEAALDENRRFIRDIYGESVYSLESLTHKYGSDVYTRGAIDKENRGHDIGSFKIEDLAEYGCKDVITCWRVAHCQIEEAEKRKHKNFIRFVTEIIGGEVYNFFHLESNGVPADKKYLLKMMSKDSPISRAIDDVKLKYKNSKHAIKANELLCSDVASNALFGLPWKFDIGKDCFHPETYVLTTTGPVKIKDLYSMGELPTVMSYNHLSGKTEFKDSVGVYKKISDKKFVCISYQGGSLRVTEDHEIWSVTKNKYIKAVDVQEDEEVLVWEVK